MSYSRTFLLLTILLVATGLQLIVMPSFLSGIQGTPNEESFAGLCDAYELATKDVVRFVGAHTLGTGILCAFLRRIQDEKLQAIVLKGMLLACLPGLIAGMGVSLGWQPMSVAVLVLALVLAGIYGQRTPTEAPTPVEDEAPTPVEDEAPTPVEDSDKSEPVDES